MDKKILVIIPCYNEEDNIVNTVENLRAVCPEVDFLVVNDCSTDSSADLLRSHHYPFLDLPVNLGIGGNVQCGYLYAVRHGYDAVSYTHLDVYKRQAKKLYSTYLSYLP